MKLLIILLILSDFSDSQYLEKMQKLIHKLPKYFTNCELQMANLNPALECLKGHYSVTFAHFRGS